MIPAIVPARIMITNNTVPMIIPLVASAFSSNSGGTGVVVGVGSAVSVPVWRGVTDGRTGARVSVGATAGKLRARDGSGSLMALAATNTISTSRMQITILLPVGSVFLSFW